MQRSLRLLVLPAALLGLMATSCGSDAGPGAASSTSSSTASSTGSGSASPAPSPTAVVGDITVFAAASLTDAFTEIGAAFARAHPQASATFSFGASSALVAQIGEGAPADVFASADTATMDTLTAAGLNATAPVPFASNVLEVIVAPGNPEGIEGVADLADDDLKVVLCAEQVPCGRYARQVLDAGNISVTPVSLEQNVKGVVTKVTSGEADAGIVYATDVDAAGDQATGVAIPAGLNVVARYPVVGVQGSAHPEVAQAFIDFLLGAEGQAILAARGFGPP